MTKPQIKDLAILQQTYLSKVQADDKSEQIRIMELIFYWIRKQIGTAQAAALGQLNPIAAAKLYPAPPLMPEQKAAFGFLQIQMIAAWQDKDIERGCEVEIEMRKWVDKQIDASVAHVIGGEIKVSTVIKGNFKKN
jgi:hypothetical protein